VCGQSANKFERRVEEEVQMPINQLGGWTNHERRADAVAEKMLFPVIGPIVVPTCVV
jgi:hypothetical protein